MTRREWSDSLERRVQILIPGERETAANLAAWVRHETGARVNARSVGQWVRTHGTNYGLRRVGNGIYEATGPQRAGEFSDVK